MKSPVCPVSPARVLYNCRMQTDSLRTSNQATFRALTNDVSLMQARFFDHAFERHSHDCYAIGTTTHGVQRFRCKGKQYDSQAGDFVLFNPDEDHDGRRGTPEGFRYAIWYVPNDFISSTLAADNGPARSRYFARPHVADPQMAGQFKRLCDSLAETGCESLRVETLVRAFLDTMLRRHGETPQLSASRSRDVNGAVLANIKDYIRTHYANDITVSDLAVCRRRLARPPDARVQHCIPHAAACLPQHRACSASAEPDTRGYATCQGRAGMRLRRPEPPHPPLQRQRWCHAIRMARNAREGVISVDINGVAASGGDGRHHGPAGVRTVDGEQQQARGRADRCQQQEEGGGIDFFPHRPQDA